MSSLKDYDGECGLIASFAHSGLQIRCNYELGHYGPCSFEKLRPNFHFMVGAIRLPDPKEGFLNSVLSHSRYEDNFILIVDGKVEIK